MNVLRVTIDIFNPFKGKLGKTVTKISGVSTEIL